MIRAIQATDYCLMHAAQGGVGRNTILICCKYTE